jgi:hypothetical protein
MPQTFSTAAMRLEDLNEALPADHFTVDWLLAKLGAQSSGLIILVFALFAAAPGVSVPAGLLVLLTAIQMVAGWPRPRFPGWIVDRPLPSRSLSAILSRAIPVLKFIERMVRRRGPAATRARQRVVGAAVLVLAIRLLTNPLPFSNVVPALVIALIALAHVEEDGLLLAVALAIGLLTLWADIAVLWKLVHPLVIAG